MSPDSATSVLDEAHAALDDTIRVGMLVPWANTVVEAELPRLGLDRVVFHYARLLPASRTTKLDHRFLRELASAVPASLEEVSRLPLATTLLACTSAGFTENSVSLPIVVLTTDFQTYGTSEHGVPLHFPDALVQTVAN